MSIADFYQSNINPEGVQSAVTWMIYGAYGFTANRIVDMAVSKGITPILAGRNRQKLEPMAAEYQLPARVFSLSNPELVIESLKDITVLLNAAGPFTETAEILVKACLQSKTHYVDITGEFTVLKRLSLYHEEAYNAGVVICPACGFDVIPTDCLAATLKQALPDADTFTLAFNSQMGISPGSAKSAIDQFAQGAIVRHKGQLVRQDRYRNCRTLAYTHDGKSHRYAAVPWGDLVSAWLTTGIPNIQVLLPLRGGSLELRLEPLLRRTLRKPWVRHQLVKLIDKYMKVPSEEELNNTQIELWGEVRNAGGEVVEATMSGPNGYKLAIEGALLFVESLLNDNKYSVAGQGGFYTPSQLLGAQVATEHLGCSPIALRYSAPMGANPEAADNVKNDAADPY